MRQHNIHARRVGAFESPPKKLYSASTTVTLFHPQTSFLFIRIQESTSIVPFYHWLRSFSRTQKTFLSSFLLDLFRLYRNFPIRYFSHSPLPFRDNSHPALALVANNRHTYISRVAVQLKKKFPFFGGAPCLSTTYPLRAQSVLPSFLNGRDR